jgi:hypothetical protein
MRLSPFQQLVAGLAASQICSARNSDIFGFSVESIAAADANQYGYDGIFDKNNV